MAEVLIVIKDIPEGGVDIALESDPPLPIRSGMTGAQTVALAMLSNVADPSEITRVNGEPVA